MTENTKNVVEITTADAIEAFRDLNEFVVALDRIGSRVAAGHDRAILADYVVDRAVTPRLARLRQLLGDALEAVVGEDEVDRIGEESYLYTDG